MFCCTLLYVHSSIAIILMEKRELVALLNLSSWCLVMVERLFLAVPWGCLRFVIVVFPDHTHLLFLRLSTLKASITTAADDKCCDIFPNFRKKWYDISLRIVCQQTIFMKYYALFVIFENAANFLYCRLLQIICGLLRVKLTLTVCILAEMYWHEYVSACTRVSLRCTHMRLVRKYAGPFIFS